MRVALIAPPAPFLLAQDVHGPLGLWYLGAALKAAGHEVAYCDMGLGDPLPDADVWCVTGTTPQRDAMRAVVEAARVPVIVGGPHATADYDDVRGWSKRALVIRGEGERELVHVLDRGLLGAGVINANRITNLDALPFPDRSQAERYTYTLRDATGAARRCATAITSRGCPNRCAFCSAGVWRHRVTLRTATNVIEEVRGLSAMGYEAVHFYDDSLAVSRVRLHTLCVGLRQLGMAWRCFVRADQVDGETLQDMARAGCVEIGLGVESGDDGILSAIHKGETVQEQRAAIHAAHAAGLRVKAFLIVGLPGETWETVERTAQFIRDTQPDDLDVSVLQLYPGSALADNPRRYGLTVEQGCGWYKGRPGQYAAGHHTADLSAADLVAARDRLEREFKEWAA